jgi:hypothetical protein
VLVDYIAYLEFLLAVLIQIPPVLFLFLMRDIDLLSLMLVPWFLCIKRKANDQKTKKQKKRLKDYLVDKTVGAAAADILGVGSQTVAGMVRRTPQERGPTGRGSREGSSRTASGVAVRCCTCGLR